MGRDEKMVMLTRLGFAARGLLYLIIAWLVIGTGRTADLSGALEYLATGKERVLLMAIAAGFIAYGVWRLSDAAFDSEGRGDDGKGLAGRAGAAASGIVYLFLAYQAWQLLSGHGGGSEDATEERAQMVLHLPAGGLLLGVAAAVLFIAGGWQLAKAYKCSFLNHLAGPVRQQEWVRWLGRIGYGARGIIFLVTAFFIAGAALSGSAGEAGGMQEALRWLSSPTNMIVAAGLALFGIFSLIEARYRSIEAPQVTQFAG